MVTGGGEEVRVLGHLSGRKRSQKSSFGGKHPGSSSLIRQSYQEAVTSEMSEGETYMRCSTAQSGHHAIP